MMPSTPPRQGKRLDTRWGEFGILAAQYFTPFFFGQPSPASLRDAWGCIDRSILLFVFGNSGAVPSEEVKESYKLVGKELEVAPNSTLSDWHRNGLRRLFDLIAGRESYLAELLSRPAVIEKYGQTGDGGLSSNGLHENKQGLIRRKKGIFRWALFLVGVFLISLAVLSWFKGKQIYEKAILVRQDAVEIQGIVKASSPPLSRVKSAAELLPKLRRDFKNLQDEIKPFLWISPWLKWVPQHGGDLASIQNLIAIADPLLAAADTSLQAVSPLLDENSLDSFNPTDLTKFLVQIQPQMVEAGRQVDAAVTARSRLIPADLSPEVRDLILNYVDPSLALMQDGLTFAEVFPRMAGATAEGPKTYLLLAQNEDELRPTGGFITAVGTVLMQDGRIASMTFENSGDLDDWTKPYPSAPWQLQRYMNSSVLVLRDSNWFTNYPTSALYAETLFSVVNAHSEDGVIAFDQQMLVEFLNVTGPVKLEGVSYPIDSSNVIAYMRTAKIPTADDLASPGWNYKVFVKKIADALAEKIYSGDIPLERLVTVLIKVLNEHHLLVQFDNPSVTALLARYHWDGVVRPGDGDYLMVVDSNVGFNKTNAVVGSSIDYDIDLTTLLSPIGSLTVIHKNNSPELICKQWYKIRFPDEDKYPIDDCYWNYLRVYLPKGAELLDSVTQDVPANWMIIKKDIPAHVDNLDEGIEGVQAFGTLQVVPGSESVTTNFRFDLPPGIIKTQLGLNQFTYHLKIQKQPGTKAVPITIRLHLPGNVTIQKAPSGAVIQGNSVLYQTDLQTDREIEVVFSLP
jgi:hypothetical protein